MRHQHGVAKLGKTPSHRRAMLRNMVTSLFLHERITTTAPKAREAKRWAERMITLGKRGDLHARRQAAAFVMDETVLKKLFDEIAPAFKDRPGGYTRMMHKGVRKGDVAKVAVLELMTKGPARPRTATGKTKTINRKSKMRLEPFKPGEKRTKKAPPKKKAAAKPAAKKPAAGAGA